VEGRKEEGYAKVKGEERRYREAQRGSV